MVVDENDRCARVADAMASKQPEEDEVDDDQQHLQSPRTDSRPPSLISRSLSEYSVRPSVIDEQDRSRTPSPTCAIV